MFLDLVGHSTTQAEISLIRSLTKFVLFLSSPLFSSSFPPLILLSPHTHFHTGTLPMDLLCCNTLNFWIQKEWKKRGFIFYFYFNIFLLSPFSHPSLPPRDELYDLMTQLLTRRIISPIDGGELGATVKIHMADGSFKSFPIQASQTGMDVVDMVCVS